MGLKPTFSKGRHKDSKAPGEGRIGFSAGRQHFPHVKHNVKHSEITTSCGLTSAIKHVACQVINKST
jgi:hypothetical protein